MRMALSLSAVIIAVLGMGPAAGQEVRSPVCTEDMACWDCTTMGNRICGSKP